MSTYVEVCGHSLDVRGPVHAAGRFEVVAPDVVNVDAHRFVIDSVNGK